MTERTMKDSCGGEDREVIYKDIVIIGNGPSGICLSYMLAGNWPYYTGEPHPGDEMLTARLQFSARPGNDDQDGDIMRGERNRFEDVTVTRSTRSTRQPDQVTQARRGELTEEKGLAHSTRHKLESLSSGIEGRSGGRPLALLMDQLQHPGVDAGLDIPSLLTWKSINQHPKHKLIDHVVLGKGQPGGAWQSMDPNVLTISLSRWMSLPDLDLRQWEMLVESEHLQEGNSPDRKQPYSHQEKISACKTASRAPVGTVAAYYKDYVRRKGLEQYFRCGTVVTSVQPTVRSNGEGRREKYGWRVDGFERKTGKRFRYRCERVVLASGTTDLFNHLGVPGENSQLDWVTHDLNDLESRLDRLTNLQCEIVHDEIKPVLVVGAGLSAADAIMAARFRGIPVLHVFRDSSSEWSRQNSEKTNSGYDRLQWLPSSMYPDYHKVYEMMADGGRNYPLYKSLPGYRLVDLSANNSSNQRIVTLAPPNGQLESFQVSVVAILIGYRADLSYLESNGIGLGRNPEKPIDSKSNPIEVDNITYEVISAPRTGLYALGPLVGDNFVRFILGGAFAILAHILCTSNI